MADGRRREEWNHTAHVLCALYHGKDPALFNPYAGRRSQGIPITAENIDALKIFVDGPLKPQKGEKPR